MFKNKKRPVVLAILDGWGVGPKDKKINAIEAAETPFFDKLKESCPSTELNATGEAVGLEKNQMSGSEAGHLNIGAGRVIKQDVRIILEEICKGRFFQNPVFSSTLNQVKKLNSNVHLMGLMGDADSPHSHPDIFLALLVLLKRNNFNGKVFVHLFTDGRDSFPQSALEHWKKWKAMMDKLEIGQLATIIGRFYAMDRAKNWSRLLAAYELMTESKGSEFESFKDVIEFNYKKGNSDEYVEPAVIIREGSPTATIKKNDAIIFFNLRSDRARQFSKFFVGLKNEKEEGFPKINRLSNIDYVAMTNFGPDLDLKTAYPVRPIECTLPFALSSRKQLYISETEKYAHVTYFINGGYSEPIGGEDRVMVKSPIVKSYAQKPEMSCRGITDVVAGNVKFGIYDFIVVNFPNADMVGHTGDFQATIRGIEAIDECLKIIYEELKKNDGILVITADHGNADIMIDKESGQLFTFHTKNPVPFIVASENTAIKNIRLQNGGKLANVAPTILELMEMYKPEEMEERSLII